MMTTKPSIENFDYVDMKRGLEIAIEALKNIKNAAKDNMSRTYIAIAAEAEQALSEISPTEHE